MNNQPERVNAGLRLASMLVDHFIMTFVCMLIAVPGIFIAMFDVFTIDHEPTDIFMGSASFMFFVAFRPILIKIFLTEEVLQSGFLNYRLLISKRERQLTH
ncbi:hypothetical protein [Marinifilum fragile]|uniref:hypothetical protein n=1 Tax=Marinifilum fragile TaxID=570161 RepID=UPI0006D16AC9|nr:hypothetical protein [Marinifilum fragile]